MHRLACLSAVVAAALLLMGAAPVARPVPPKPVIPPKPAAAVKAETARAILDLRDPASLVSILVAAGAKAQVTSRGDDAVLVSVTSAAANFSAQFADCDRQGRACKAALFDAPLPGSPTLAQLNGFNQASALCRGYLDKSGRAHVTLSTLLFADDTREHAVTALAAWQGCLGDFAGFLKDPAGYLASAP